ncbi:hypothetical protein G7054_g964 [Neopestalotiopsis clavispora]|nr:hypothetical protein G7054_g964 [Neopestalotiopsis clavispora]
MKGISAKVFHVKKKRNTETPAPDIPDVLIKKIQKSAIGASLRFYPSGCWEDVITTETAAAALGLSPSQQKKETSLLEFIVKEAKIVFAILSSSPFLIRNPEKLLTAIRKFQVDKFGDNELPLVLDDEPQEPLDGATTLSRTATHQSMSRVNTIQTQGDSYLLHFVQEQWKFLAPVFKAPNIDTQNNQDIGQGNDEYEAWVCNCDSEAILPFIHKSNEVKSGAFGDVWCVTAHPNHVPDEWSRQIALKEVKLDAKNSGTEEARKSWLRELHGHVEMNGLLHPNIVKFYGAVIQDTRQWFMMEWANGGTLQEFMIKNPSPPLTPEFLNQILQQIRALAHALECMHAEDQKNHHRHGDLKPANILRFKTTSEEGSDVDVGIWKIGDMGLVKKQTVNTSARGWSTTTRKSTIRYHPPEVLTQVNGGKWSRRYDVWSMGCIAFEVIIWLLWGQEGLANLDDALIQIQSPMETGSYFTRDPAPPYSAKIHPAITKAMHHIDSHPNGKADTMLGKLLEVIRTKLLVINVPTPPEGADNISAPLDTSIATSSSPRVSVSASEVLQSERKSAKDFRGDLDIILQDLSRSPPRMAQGRNAVPIFRVSASGNLTVPDARPGGLLHASTQGRTGQIPSPLQRAVSRHSYGLPRQYTDRRVGNSPTADSSIAPKHIQLGVPRLLESKSAGHFGLLKQWLRDCNDNHAGCKSLQQPIPPTRLIHVGDERNEGIRLCEPQRDSEIKYAALSHPWGEGEHFCTLPHTLQKHKDGIIFQDLPATFQDAIVATRATGLQYLWIDSICIVQGPGGDFDQEAALMETVFSSADFVIAASSARGQHDGFLREQACDWQTVTFERESQPTYYVRPFVDDFAKDVLNSPLNSRGWVLQERALARRTIYFTMSQTYFECGEGVRCETLTRTTNKLASMLGDARFPSKMSGANADRGELIRSYQSLYTQYSALGLTRITDRPIAIAGLEKRLIQDLKAVGGYGVFDDKRSLLQHSLLWQRRTGVPALGRIDFSKTSYMAPTWSWMAYDGPIDFVDVPLGGVDWENDEVRSPWAISSTETWYTGQTTAKRHLKVLVRDLIDYTSIDTKLVYDNPSLARPKQVQLQCVVLGRQKTKGVARDNIIHYVVLVAATTTAGQDVRTYERIGVGSLPGKHINLDNKRPLENLY